MLLIGPWLLVAVLLAAVLLAPTVLGFHFERSKAAAVPSDSQAVPGKPGPWGQLEYRPIRIDLPDEFVFVPPPDQPPVRWFFHGFSKEQALEFLQSSGITPAQRALIEKAPWKSEAESVSVEPGDEFHTVAFARRPSSDLFAAGRVRRELASDRPSVVPRGRLTID